MILKLFTTNFSFVENVRLPKEVFPEDFEEIKEELLQQPRWSATV